MIKNKTMRKFFILLALIAGIVKAQAFNNFSDGAFTNDPEWVGTTDLFRIDPENGMFQLYAPAVAGEAWLFTQSEAAVDAQWQFFFRMNFNPTDNNHCRVYLTADTHDINTINNAYYLVIGAGSSAANRKNICLWERRNGVDKRLITGITDRLSYSNVFGLVRVTRNENGDFILESNILNGGWVEEGRYQSSISMVSNYFGFSCRYTQTRNRHFWFGNFEINGTPYIDTSPPEIVNFEVINRYSFRIKFSKPIENLIFDNTNFTVESNNKHPNKVQYTENDPYSVILFYNESIPVNGENILAVRNISDIEGNTMTETLLPFNYQPTIMTDIVAEDLRTINFLFNREIDFTNVSINNFSWKNEGPDFKDVTMPNSDCIKLELNSDFPNGQTLEIYLNNLISINGDSIDKGPYPVNITLREWVGTTELFIINNLGDNIQLDAPREAGQAWLFTESDTMDEAQWQLNFRMNFNPSSQNYNRIYLTADNSDINSIQNAYYLVLGTSADNICLWERRNGINIRRTEGAAGRLDMNNVNGAIKVKRDENRKFIIESNISGQGWIEEGIFEDSQGMESNYFGFSCHYTLMNHRNFYFSNFEISGKPFINTTPPEIVNFEVINRYNFRIKFSKPIETLKYNKTNFYIVSDGRHPDVIQQVENDLYSIELLYFSGITVDNYDDLTIRNISNNDGYVIPNTSFRFVYNPTIVTVADIVDLRTIIFGFSRQIDFETVNNNTFSWKDGGPDIENIINEASNRIKIELDSDFPNAQLLEMYIHKLVAMNGDTIAQGPYPIFQYYPQRNDVIISEIMYRTNTLDDFPDSQYIEFYNRSEYPVQLQGFTIKINNNTPRQLNAYLLFPDDYVILVPNPQNDNWAFIPNRIAVTNWQNLTTGGGTVVLNDKFGNTVTALEYSPNMGDAGFKRNSGWSLEIIDPDNFSGDWNNFNFSEDKRGGTPGSANSIAGKYPDVEPPQLLDWYVEDGLCLITEFSEPLNPDKIPLDFNIEPNNLNITSITIEEPFLKTIKISFSEIITENKIYNFSFGEKPEDFAGNSVSNINNFSFGVPVNPENGDVIINELLYNPPAGGSLFVELYNRSDNLIDLSELFISRNINTEGVPEKLIQLTDKPIVFLPKSYIAFTTNRTWLLDYYNIENERTVRQVSNLPNFVNTGGMVLLTNKIGEIFERFDYSEKLHFSLLTNTKGVSLERISSEEPAKNSSNWHSAAAEHKYATPGKINSQTRVLDYENQNDFVSIEPQIFTPNGDGIDDLLFIRYKFDEPGNICTVTIFNRAGHPVRHLQNNFLAGTEGFFTWDGLNDNYQRCPSGIYIIWFRSFILNGNVKESKKTAVLGYGKQ